MKHLKFIIFFISYTILAQTNFKVENNQLSWQKVYTSTQNYNTINQFLKTTGFTTFTSDISIDFEKELTPNNLIPFGFKWGKFPTYLTKGYFIGTIDFKDGKYRVTITKISLMSAFDNTVYLDLAEYITNKNTLKTSKSHQKVITTLDAYFTNEFTFKTTDDW